ncbi:MAG: CoA-binding protein [Bacteroidetes bacterium]|nr:CoA-binding protein [Bacteroidota bacterium]
MTNFKNTSVLVIGASENPERYAYKAIKLLNRNGYNVSALAIKAGNIDTIDFSTNTEDLKKENIDTVTLYVNSKNQEKYKEFIIQLKPRRVIFNPGTENEDFYDDLKRNNIAYEEACTLILLNTGQF